MSTLNARGWHFNILVIPRRGCQFGGEGHFSWGDRGTFGWYKKSFIWILTLHVWMSAPHIWILAQGIWCCRQIYLKFFKNSILKFTEEGGWVGPTGTPQVFILGVGKKSGAIKSLPCYWTSFECVCTKITCVSILFSNLNHVILHYNENHRVLHLFFGHKWNLTSCACRVDLSPSPLASLQITWQVTTCQVNLSSQLERRHP